MSFRSLPLSLASCLLVLFLACCEGRDDKVLKETRPSLYTVVSMTVVSRSEKIAQPAIDNAFGELEKLGRLMNFYSPDSELAAINRNAGERPVKVSPETLEVVERALFVSERTQGAFDITVGPLVRLWDIKAQRIPEEASLQKAMQLVGYQNVLVDKVRSTVYLKKKGMEIDLGGIMKGYAADRAVEVLKARGIRSGIVTVGGEVKAFGTRPGGEPWVVGIKNPRQKGSDDELLATLKLTDRAVSTSGDYEKYFVKDAKRYHHIIDPKTGYPAQGCASATVLASDAVLTDGLSTGVFVLGPKKGLEVLRDLGLDGVMVDDRGNMSVTEGLKGSLEMVLKGTQP